MRHLLRRRHYYKWNFWLAHALSLLLLLEDVELNPSPHQSETHDELGLPAPAVNPAIDQTGAEGYEYMYCKVKKSSGMAMQLVCQRKRPDTETVEEHCARLVKVADNQRLCVAAVLQGLLHLMKIRGNGCSQKPRMIVV